MKTEQEIRKEIDRLENLLINDHRKILTTKTIEWLKGQILALQWVIGE